jgi:integrase
MPKTGEGLQNLMTPREREILEGFIIMKANSGAKERTQQKVRHICYKLLAVLHGIRPGCTLDTATYADFAAVPSKLTNKNGDAITQNSRQSFITTLKALTSFMKDDMDLEIEGKEHTFDKIKAGASTQENKDEITPEEWQRVLNCHMTTRDRALLTLMYDGCLRPGEPLVLKWSDFKINDEGAIQYQITFKTTKPRDIVMKPDAVAVLEEWRRASGWNYGDNVPLFPDRCGGHYSTIEPVVKLFRRLRKESGIPGMTPGSIRNSAITADVMAGFSEAYVCFRCWGEASNPMINTYVRKARAAKMQAEQQRKINGSTSGTPEPEKPRKIANLKPCPSCGKPNAVNGMFCAYCGHSMSGDKESVIGKLEARIQEQQNSMANILSEVKAMRERYEGFEVWRKKPGQTDDEYWEQLRQGGFVVELKKNSSGEVIGSHIYKK